MKLLLLLLLGVPGLPARAQATTKLNRPLQRELDIMLTLDQRYRHLLAASRQPRQADSLEVSLHLPKGQLFTYALAHMQHVDSSNLRRLEVLMRRYGYPGKSLVSTPANEAAWYVIQHSDKIPQYLPLVKTAAEKREIPYWMYAQMLDRQLMEAGQEQLYGTQAAGYTVLSKRTGQPEQVRFLWPVADPAHADERRRRAGFPDTLRQSAQDLLDGPYQPVTLDYAKRMQREAAALYRQQPQP